MLQRTLLITGGAGYIGSHIAYAAAKKGWQVIVLDSFVHQQQFSPSWAQVIRGDYADTVLLARIFSQYPIQAVVHCASFIEVGISVQKPLSFYENNVAKTITLLEAMLKHHVHQLIFSSSCAVYGMPEQLPLSENHPTKPLSPYGRTKLMIEHILQDVSSASSLRFVSLRYFNAAGALAQECLGEQHKPETHIIPLLIQAALQQMPFKVFGTDYPTKDGTAIRDYVHVLDIAQAHLLALEYLERTGMSDCFNLGSGDGFSVKELIAAAQDAMKTEIKVVYEQARKGDAPTLIANPHKAHTILGWKPVYKDLSFMLKSALAFLTKECLVQSSEKQTVLAD